MAKFRTAARKAVWLRLLLLALTKQGKTYTALTVAHHMAKLMGVGPERIFVVDAEEVGEDGTGRSELEAGAFCRCQRCGGRGIKLEGHQVAVLGAHELNPFGYVETIEAARLAGAAILVVDGITPEWEACLREVDDSNLKDKHARWGEPTKKHDAFLRALKTFPGHVIATCRVKEKHEKQGGDLVSLGLQPIQRDGIGYEFDAELDLHRARGTLRSRIDMLNARSWERPGEDLAELLLRWSREGVAIVDQQKANVVELTKRVSALGEPEKAKATEWMSKHAGDPGKVSQFLARLRERDAKEKPASPPAQAPAEPLQSEADGDESETKAEHEALGVDFEEAPAGDQRSTPESGSGPPQHQDASSSSSSSGSGERAQPEGSRSSESLEPSEEPAVSAPKPTRPRRRSTTA